MAAFNHVTLGRTPEARLLISVTMMARYAIFWLLAGLLVCCGCSSLASSWNSFSPFVDRPVVASRQNPVVEIACMWQPGEGRGPKGVPARGFAGQIYFFTRNNSEPVLGEGDVRVYLFADTGTLEERAKPLHQYDFMAEAWKTHATRTSLGPGYSVFIPYPEQAHYQVRCQLRVRFQPPQGPPIWSEALSMVLDGPPRPDDEPITWMTEDGESQPKNQLEISPERVSADQIAERQERDEKAEESTLRVDTFDVSELRQAFHEKSWGDAATDEDIKPARLDSAHFEREAESLDSHLAEHPITQMSEAEKQEIIRRVLGGEGGGRQGLRRDGESEKPREEVLEAHPLSESFEEPSEAASSDHPLRRGGEEALEDGWSRHPLSSSATSGTSQLSTVEPELNARHPQSSSSASFSEDDSFSDDERDRWRSVRRPHPLSWHERADEIRRRFVAPRPNRAVLLSRRDSFTTRADGLDDDAISTSDEDGWR